MGYFYPLHVTRLLFIVLCLLCSTIYYNIFVFMTSYIFGSFMGAQIISFLFTLKDPARYGSYNVGTSNVTRISGLQYGAMVFIIDFVKIICALLLFPQNIYFVCYGCLLGHGYPLLGHGGKSMSVFFGIMAYLNIYIFILLGLTWLLICYLSTASKASISTLITAVIFNINSFIFHDTEMIVHIAIMACIIICFHKKFN